MSNIITLSSSPPAVFARSPTPVTFSSSPRKLLDSARGGHVDAPNQFKPAQALRDGFPSSFITARDVLGIKSSAENVPIASAKPLQTKPTRLSEEDPEILKTAPTIRRAPLPQNCPGRPVSSVDSLRDDAPPAIVVQILPSDVKRTRKSRTVNPLNLEKAAARRRDWTPTKPMSKEETTSTSGFSIDLKQSFGHMGQDASPGGRSFADDNASCKRRKISAAITSKVTPTLNHIALTRGGKSVLKTRNKSPTKKPLTITGLTTSKYLEESHNQENSTLMMQFLASTQARMQSDGASDTFETKVTRKPTASRVIKSRSKLKSPRTSMKTICEQDIVFASASQLARDESPALLRDTIEAIKQSEDSFCETLTQQTAPISVEATSPNDGIARYRGRRNLWGAAHRDENDALLYHSDPVDDPKIGVHLAEKDAVFEVDSVQIVNNGEGNSLALLATLHKESTITYDIDDLTTPLAITSTALPRDLRRSYSTSSRSPSSKRTKDSVSAKGGMPCQLTQADVNLETPKIPAKPNYASWTDEQLKEQVNEYGFKRLRARKTMIDKLDEHWAQKYGLDIAAVKAATKAASRNPIDRDHGSFLSKVHELAPRPVLKQKKSRTKRAGSDTFGTVSKRKSRSKLVAVPDKATAAEDNVFDIDEIDHTTVLERLASINPFPDEQVDFLEPSTAPVKGTGVKATIKRKAKGKTKVAERLLTPPPTVPEDPILDSSPGFASPSSKPLATKIIDIDTSLKSQIRTALLNPSGGSKPRNHQKNPSWHEKMLLYDPIVLEDFTAWLNTEGFNAIGIDDEIDAKDVKVWCEENGICCLWKGGWRGNKVKE